MTKALISNFVIFVLCILTFTLQAQKVVVDYNPRVHNIVNDLPDANNKIFLPEVFPFLENTQRGIEEISIYPNWPINYEGPSFRAGIYANMDDDPDLEIIYNVRQQVHVWNIDGSEVDGWPQTVGQGNCFLYRGPAFGDIDGDGEGDIVVSTGFPGTGISGWLYAFSKDGTPKDGFPFELPNGGASYGPVLADLNEDGPLEIIVAERGNFPTGFIGVYDGSGNAYAGFPQALDHVPASPVAVGDINGDGKPEIIAESYISVFAFDVNGSSLPGFPYNLGNGDDRVLSYSSPVLADLTGDGHREILFGDHALSSGNGAVHILKSDGSLLPGWPQYTSHGMYAPVAVADIDLDGELEIIVGDKYLSMSPSSKMYVWNTDGVMKDGWPSSGINSVNTQVIIANFDDDPELELVWDDNTPDGVFIGYNADGTPMGGDWPLYTAPLHTTHFCQPFIMDVDNDGYLDISGACRDENGYCKFFLWYTDVPYDSAAVINPVLQYNVQHTGVFPQDMSTGIEEIENDHEILVLTDNLNRNIKVKTTENNERILSIRVYALNGSVVRYLEVNSRQAGINHLPLGMFVLEIVTSKGVVSKKVLFN